MQDGTLLAIDSATDRLYLAAGGPAGTAYAVSGAGAQASAELIERARTLLAGLGIDWAALDAIAFGRGPGAFTGLRTACAVAQGLAFGLGRPAIAIDSLMLVAEAAWPWAAQGTPARNLGVVVDARMGEVYAARYAHGPAGWVVTEAPHLSAPAALWAPGSAERPDAWAGSGVAMMAAVAPLGGPEAGVSDEARAAALLRLAQAAWRRGDTVAAENAWPVYVRDKVAQTTAERMQAARPAAA